MYNVLTMGKRYTVAAVRQRLAEALDAADKGIPVFIERRGVRYRLSVETAVPRAVAGPPRITIIDPAVEDGQWSWEWTADGVQFADTRPE